MTSIEGQCWQHDTFRGPSLVGILWYQPHKRQQLCLAARIEPCHDQKTGRIYRWRWIAYSLPERVSKIKDEPSGVGHCPTASEAKAAAEEWILKYLEKTKIPA